jgi:hypothetical protein
MRLSVTVDNLIEKKSAPGPPPAPSLSRTTTSNRHNGTPGVSRVGHEFGKPAGAGLVSR